MTDSEPKLSIEQKIVFAVSPEGQGDGVPLLLVGVPAGAWDYMKDGKTHHFDLTKIGLPCKFIFFGAESHDAAMAILQEGAKARGEAYLDERRRDFSIPPKPQAGKITRDGDYPAEYAHLVAALNLCADGHSQTAVLNASLQMVAAAIGAVARAKGSSIEDTLAYTEYVAGCILASVRENWRRVEKASDVVVRPS